MLRAVARRAGAARARDAPSLARASAAMSCRLIASTSASSSSGGTKCDPSALCAEMVSYARKAWRSGDRVTATGVLEHGADLIARAAEGQPAVAAAAQAAKSRTHLAWADMQSVRLRVPETEATRLTAAANAMFAKHVSFATFLGSPLPSSNPA